MEFYCKNAANDDRRYKFIAGEIYFSYYFAAYLQHRAVFGYRYAAKAINNEGMRKMTNMRFINKLKNG